MTEQTRTPARFVGEQVAGWIRNVARGVSAVMSVLKYAVRKEPVAPVVAAK